MKTYTAELPAFLASALFNGDTSSLDESDEKMLAEILAFHAPAQIVSCSEEPFFATICYAGGRWFTGDVLEYTLLEGDK